VSTGECIGLRVKQMVLLLPVYIVLLTIIGQRTAPRVDVTCRQEARLSRRAIALHLARPFKRIQARPIEYTVRRKKEPFFFYE